MKSSDWLEPPVTRALPHAEIHFWRANLAAQADNLPAWENLLSADEMARANRFVFVKDRTHYICARAILRVLLGRYLAASPAQLAFAYTAHGKPYLPAAASPLHFNLTHSGDIALYAFSRAGRVGIDVELVRDDLPFRTLMESVFTARERAEINALPDEQARRAFFTGWTRKEAFIKARGEGLSYALDQFEVSMLPEKPFTLRLLAQIEGEGPIATQWSTYALEAGNAYCAAGVSEGVPQHPRCYRFTASHPELR